MSESIPPHLASFLTESHPPPPDPLNRRVLNLMYRALWKHRYRGSMKWNSKPHLQFLSRIESNAAFEAHAGQCDTGIVVTIWNRPHYLERCLETLSRSDLAGAVVVLVDDASDDADTLELVRGFDLPTPVIKLFKRENTSMHVGLDIGWCLLSKIGCDYLCNLDADTIVRSDWLKRLRSMMESLPWSSDTVLLSGFNRSNSPSVLEEHEQFLLKYRMGGANYFFTPGFFRQVRHLMFNANWDSHIQYYCGDQFADRYRMVCLRPSVVQHIGREGINSGVNSPFDSADDFVMD